MFDHGQRRLNLTSLQNVEPWLGGISTLTPPIEPINSAQLAKLYDRIGTTEENDPYSPQLEMIQRALLLRESLRAGRWRTIHFWVYTFGLHRLKRVCDCMADRFHFPSIEIVFGQREEEEGRTSSINSETIKDLQSLRARLKVLVATAMKNSEDSGMHAYHSRT